MGPALIFRNHGNAVRIVAVGAQPGSVQAVMAMASKVAQDQAADRAAIRVDSCTLPLFWPWLLDRFGLQDTERGRHRVHRSFVSLGGHSNA